MVRKKQAQKYEESMGEGPYFYCTKVLGSGRFEKLGDELLEVEYVDKMATRIGELVYLKGHKERHQHVPESELRQYPDIIIRNRGTKFEMRWEPAKSKRSDDSRPTLNHVSNSQSTATG